MKKINSDEFIKLDKLIGSISKDNFGDHYINAGLNAMSLLPTNDISPVLFVMACADALIGVCGDDDNDAIAKDIVGTVKAFIDKKHVAGIKNTLWADFTYACKKAGDKAASYVEDNSPDSRIDLVRVGEIKTIISEEDSTPEAIRKAWIDYGNMLLICPEKNGRKIGEWVKKNHLDFIPTAIRSNAKSMATLYNDNVNIFDGCPCGHPVKVLQWLRDKDKPVVEAVSQPVDIDDLRLPADADVIVEAIVSTGAAPVADSASSEPAVHDRASSSDPKPKRKALKKDIDNYSSDIDQLSILVKRLDNTLKAELWLMLCDSIDVSVDSFDRELQMNIWRRLDSKFGRK
jgi:hypothetical protein